MTWISLNFYFNNSEFTSICKILWIFWKIHTIIENGLILRNVRQTTNLGTWTILQSLTHFLFLINISFYSSHSYSKHKIHNFIAFRAYVSLIKTEIKNIFKQHFLLISGGRYLLKDIYDKWFITFHTLNRKKKSDDERFNENRVVVLGFNVLKHVNFWLSMSYNLQDFFSVIGKDLNKTEYGNTKHNQYICHWFSRIWYYMCNISTNDQTNTLYLIMRWNFQHKSHEVIGG
jgi:hypothetical protein